MKIFLKILLSFLLMSWFVIPLSASEPNASIDLTVTNIRNEKGFILISVYNQPQGFPSDSTMIFRSYILDAKSPSLSHRIENLPSGKYAIAIVHDENQNKELDANFMGAPIEGFASSGSNRRFSAPKFESSAFKVLQGNMKVEIRMNYLF